VYDERLETRWLGAPWTTLERRVADRLSDGPAWDAHPRKNRFQFPADHQREVHGFAATRGARLAVVLPAVLSAVLWLIVGSIVVVKLMGGS
jgi:hypothetical protein